MINSLFRQVFKMALMRFVHLPVAFTSQPLCPLRRIRHTMIYLQCCLIISVLLLFGTILSVGGCFRHLFGNSTSNESIGILVMGLLTISVLLIIAMSKFGKNLQ